jgi:uncharacterized protein YjbI with pentapeptide repeats
VQGPRGVVHARPGRRRGRPPRQVPRPAAPRGLEPALKAIASPQAPRFEDEPLAVTDLTDGAEGARLVDAEISSASLRGLRLVDVIVERGNLANLVAPEATLRRVVITGARLTGLQLTRGTVSDAVFRDCRIDLATFAGTAFERVVFEGCMLAQVELRESLLRSTRFDHCDLTEADLTGLRLDGCELRSCTLDGVVALERLRGAAMPWADVVGHAGELAAALGIRLLDD